MCDSVYNCAFLTWQLSLFVFKFCRCYFIMMPMRKVVKINNLNIALKKNDWFVIYFSRTLENKFCELSGWQPIKQKNSSSESRTFIQTIFDDKINQLCIDKVTTMKSVYSQNQILSSIGGISCWTLKYFVHSF